MELSLGGFEGIDDILTSFYSDPPPSNQDQKMAIDIILASDPDILLFAKHWWWLTDKACPERHNNQSNISYAKRHWHKLVKASKLRKELIEKVDKILDKN